MTSRRIDRTEYRVPGSGLPRLGNTSHAESGVDVEGYLQPLEQVHGSAHGTGVVEGLAVTAIPGSAVLRVAPGVAVDASGRHIALASGGVAEIGEDPDQASTLVPVDGTGVQLPTTGSTGALVLTVQWRETFDQDLFTSSGQKIFQDNHTPWLRLVASGDLTADQVVLAAVSLDAGGVIGAAGLTAGARSGPAPFLTGVRLRAPAAASGGTGLSVSDLLTGEVRARPGGGLLLDVGDPGGELEVAAATGTFGVMTVAADRLAVLRGDGTAPITLDGADARIGVGTDAPSHALHVTDNRGIRQNLLFLTGGPAWSSLAYNAHHTAANNDWTFVDPARPGVTMEMDDAGGVPRWQVWTTTAAAPTAWNLRLGIDGSTGVVSVPGQLSVSGGATLQGGVSVNRDSSDQPSMTVINQTGTAVCAQSAGQGRIAISAIGATALWALGASQLIGDVDVNGTLTANSKNFSIDHPGDPENRYLVHTSVEAAERLNIYGGTVTLEADGTARVTLPDWAEQANTGFRYQLTGIGAAGSVYVAAEVADGGFTIAGGEPGQRVCWQLTGVRDDPWARAHPLIVEPEKPDAEKGHYQYPAAYGQGLRGSVHWPRNAEQIRQNPRLMAQLTRDEADAARRHPALGFLD